MPPFRFWAATERRGRAITFNGGSYDARGTFLTFIDQDGTITFNNANAHADVLKAGVFGSNGVLNIGGGMLSADTTLKLYAPGSNGRLNFISNVTLGGNSAKILAANSVTIFDNVVVTIGGSKPADVYTGFTGETPNANYTGFGGNGSTTGTFGRRRQRTTLNRSRTRRHSTTRIGCDVGGNRSRRRENRPATKSTLVAQMSCWRSR